MTKTKITVNFVIIAENLQKTNAVYNLGEHESYDSNEKILDPLIINHNR